MWGAGPGCCCVRPHRKPRVWDVCFEELGGISSLLSCEIPRSLTPYKPLGVETSSNGTQRHGVHKRTLIHLNESQIKNVGLRRLRRPERQLLLSTPSRLSVGTVLSDCASVSGPLAIDLDQISYLGAKHPGLAVFSTQLIAALVYLNLKMRKILSVQPSFGKAYLQLL